jgi:hypothetical protein
MNIKNINPVKLLHHTILLLEMFIVLSGGRLINIEYIKIITLSYITVANTEDCSVSNYKNAFSSISKSMLNTRIDITPEEYASIVEQLEYPNKIALLEAENKQLKLEIMYRPGGPGFDMAEKHFTDTTSPKKIESPKVWIVDDYQYIIGMTLDQGREAVKPDAKLRVIEEDGIKKGYQEDLQYNRLNIAIRDTKITELKRFF